jgi:uncharacterized DUF497 family protein
MYNYPFIWDEDKYKLNIQKHGISFEEAATVFDDENALYKHDIDHSQYEERFIIIGKSKYLKLLVVCHCYKESSNTIRIFSARKATKNEIKQYGGYYEG